MDDLPPAELETTVVVPAAPGPLLRLRDLVRERDEIDDVLDDLFGEDDERGPGAADAVLLAGGVGAVVVAQLASWPGVVTVLGAIAAALGAVLPARTLLRRMGHARHSRRLRGAVGDGVVLRIDHPSVAALVAAHDRALAASHGSAADGAGLRVAGIAHAAVHEVATLLAGHRPSGAAEVEYVDARARALTELARAVGAAVEGRIADGRRRALLEARDEVERIAGGSSVSDAADLVRELGGDDAT